jgi:hypothetical protein
VTGGTGKLVLASKRWNSLRLAGEKQQSSKAQQPAGIFCHGQSS